jgi:hypothetical protein
VPIAPKRYTGRRPESIGERAENGSKHFYAGGEQDAVERDATVGVHVLRDVRG